MRMFQKGLMPGRAGARLGLLSNAHFIKGRVTSSTAVPEYFLLRFASVSPSTTAIELDYRRYDEMGRES
jgi:hypothetical protein